MKAKDIASSAADLVGGDRKEAYGDVVSGLTRIAILWNAHMHAVGNAPPRPMTVHDVAWMMLELKHGRAFTGPFRLDNYIDAAGWAAIAGEAASRMEKANGSNS